MKMSCLSEEQAKYGESRAKNGESQLPGSAHTIAIPTEHQTSKMLQGCAFKDCVPVIERTCGVSLRKIN